MYCGISVLYIVRSAACYGGYIHILHIVHSCTGNTFETRAPECKQIVMKEKSPFDGTKPKSKAFFQDEKTCPMVMNPHLV